jgi:hypothetical protein
MGTIRLIRITCLLDRGDHVARDFKQFSTVLLICSHYFASLPSLSSSVFIHLVLPSHHHHHHNQSRIIGMTSLFTLTCLISFAFLLLFQLP